MFIIDFFKKVGSAIKGGAKKVASVTVDFSQDVFFAFKPLLETEAAEFVKDFRDIALKIVLQAAAQFTNNGDKVKFFAKELGKAAKTEGIHFLKDHLVNLLREVVVAEAKARNLI